MKKRFIAMAAVLCILISMFAGCGSSSKDKDADFTKKDINTETLADTSEYGDTGGLKLPITTKSKCVVTWLTTAEASDVDWENTPAFKEIKKRTGIDVVIQGVPEDAYLEKVNTCLASKNLPNLMNVGVEIANTYGEQGAFVSLNEHLDLIPNFKSVVVDNPDNNWYLKSYSTESGNIYGWPTIDLQRRVNHMYMYRKDIFDKNGLTIWNPGDSEGVYETLKKLKEIYPNSVPMSSKMGNSFWAYQQSGWGLNAGGWGHMALFENNRTWKYAKATGEFKDMLDYFKKLYKEGLLDPEFLTNTQNAWIAKMAEPETTFLTFDWISRMDLFIDQVKDENPEYELSPAPPIGPTGKTYPLPKLQWFGVVVSKITDNSMEALQLVDYLFSPSGAKLMTIGIEGDWFNFDENGKPIYTDLKLKDLEAVNINNLSETYGMWNDAMFVRVDRRSIYHFLTPKEQAANDIIVNRNLFLPEIPILGFDDAVVEKNAEILTNLNTKAFEFAMHYVMNPDYGEDDWKKWLAEAKVLEIDEIEKNYNDAQKIYDAK